eukprot:2425415-Pleurochrysis_carterae.AAC.1
MNPASERESDILRCESRMQQQRHGCRRGRAISRTPHGWMYPRLYRIKTNNGIGIENRIPGITIH